LYLFALEISALLVDIFFSHLAQPCLVETLLHKDASLTSLDTHPTIRLGAALPSCRDTRVTPCRRRVEGLAAVLRRSFFGRGI
jgi:hypothetical protein